MRILLLGATGQVGWELSHRLGALGELTTTARDGTADLKLDVTDLAALRNTLDAMQPDLIVNATGYTAVDQAEQEPELAMRLNADVPGRIGDWAAWHGATVMHYSTDYVFDGNQQVPYRESDEPNPLNVYGRTKLAGEDALLASECRAFILRVGWVYGNRRRNFLCTVQQLLEEQREIRMVNDQRGTPTWCRSIAECTGSIIEALTASDRENTAAHGIYHLAPAGDATWHEFACAIRDELGFTCAIRPIATTEYPLAARRPACSVLATDKLSHTFGITLPHWRDLLSRSLAVSRPETGRCPAP